MNVFTKMKFLKLILVSFLFASCAMDCVSAKVAAFPLPAKSTNTFYTFNSHPKSTIAGDFSFTIPSANRTVTDDIKATPPLVFVGKSGGKMVRCFHKRCVTFNTASSDITAMAVSGEYIFAGLSSGIMLRCSLYTPDDCQNFNAATDPIKALAITGGHIYYSVLNSQLIWQCELDQANSCLYYHSASQVVTSLAANDKFLFAGLSSRDVLRCRKEPSSNPAECVKINSADKPIISLAATANELYIATGTKTITACDIVGHHHCMEKFVAYSKIKSINIIQNSVFAATESGVWTCPLDMSYPCAQNTNTTGALSIVNIYGTFALQDRKRNEDKQCNWQDSYDAHMCPPYVVYYGLKQRLMFEVFISEGKVYNSRGQLLDSAEADFSHTGKAAMFVMAPNGQIFASNNHKIYLLHHSSMLAGHPAAAAGELFVDQGVIRKITTCSGHYRSNLELNRQLIESLRLKGYNKRIDSQLCSVDME